MRQSLRNFIASHKIAIAITVVFLLVVVVFGNNRLSKVIATQHRINVMKREQMIYIERSREDSTFLENLKQDWFLEKYAREKFYMKAPGEEIYLVE